MYTVIQFISVYAFVTLGKIIEILQMIFWWISHEKACDAELRCFLWSAPEQTA